MNMNNLTIGELTQSLLALAVVIGGGAILVFEPDTGEQVTALIGLVLGFYFNRANGLLRKPPEGKGKIT